MSQCFDNFTFKHSSKPPGNHSIEAKDWSSRSINRKWLLLAVWVRKLLHIYSVLHVYAREELEYGRIFFADA